MNYFVLKYIACPIVPATKYLWYACHFYSFTDYNSSVKRKKCITTFIRGTLFLIPLYLYELDLLASHFGLNNLFVLCPWQRGKKGLLALKQKILLNSITIVKAVYWSIRIIKSNQVSIFFLKTWTQVEHSRVQLSRVQLDISLLHSAHSWDMELNTWREIPYLCALMYYSLYTSYFKILLTGVMSWNALK